VLQLLLDGREIDVELCDVGFGSILSLDNMIWRIH
jgi:hypothetical protein